MSSVLSPYRRLLVIMVWLLVICLAAHFLHDLQPGHLVLTGAGSASQVCHMAIHIGFLGGIIPVIALTVLTFSIVPFPPLIFHTGLCSVPLPPPIPA